MRRESGAAMTRGELTTTAWRTAKTSSKLSAIVVNVSSEACFALPGFTNFASLASMVMTLSSLLSSSASLVVSSSFDHYLIDQAKVFRSLPVYDYPWRIAASVRNGGRRMVLRGVQSL